jgi:uncharacterized membrane protein (UPF0136 family)
MRTVTFHFIIGLLLGGLAGGGAYYVSHDDTVALIVGCVVAVLYWIIAVAVKTGNSGGFDIDFDVSSD